ncbi:MAG: hypothetical protein JZU50_11610 [Desulfobulbaceae bacterium]|nr:hypothetical protein [Desulfobulbaceae bacterium]
MQPPKKTDATPMWPVRTAISSHRIVPDGRLEVSGELLPLGRIDAAGADSTLFSIGSFEVPLFAGMAPAQRAIDSSIYQQYLAQNISR